ncbi:MAG: host attachment protein [Beijerinckiaceae bacterium]|nr:host attachment protein [Beijerinckiaceae bacterium]MDO9440826.1 host attachment protein [Beijerinckiaceae bacterium]
MQLPHGLVVAVVDGEILNLYSNTGDERQPKLSAFELGPIDGDNKSSGARHSSSSANPDESRQEEDSFAAAVAAKLNQQALAGAFESLFVIATPKTLGELRKHYHKALEAKLLGELAKDLTGHSVADIEAALAKAN